MEFSRSLLEMRPYLEPSKNCLETMNERVEKLKRDLDPDVAEVAEQGDYELLLTRKKVLRELEAFEVKATALNKTLSAREAREIEERKKRAEEADEEEQYKCDYLPYSHANRIGLAKGSKGLKNFK